MSELPDITITPLTKPYWDGLASGRLLYQRCRRCDNAWLPARDACPRCLETDFEWVASSGAGSVVSWVVYHVAYHESFKSRVPYDVTLVELDEGPRLITNIVDSDEGRALRPGARVTLQIEPAGNVYIPRFRLAKDCSEAETISLSPSGPALGH